MEESVLHHSFSLLHGLPNLHWFSSSRSEANSSGSGPLSLEEQPPNKANEEARTATIETMDREERVM